MPDYLVERYVPRHKTDELGVEARRARALAEDLSRGGRSIRYVRTTLLPDDETCFHLFEADSAETVSDLCARAGLQHARIVRAVEP